MALHSCLGSKHSSQFKLIRWMMPCLTVAVGSEYVQLYYRDRKLSRSQPLLVPEVLYQDKHWEVPSTLFTMSSPWLHSSLPVGLLMWACTQKSIDTGPNLHPHLHPHCSSVILSRKTQLMVETHRLLLWEAKGEFHILKNSSLWILC